VPMQNASASKITTASHSAAWEPKAWFVNQFIKTCINRYDNEEKVEIDLPASNGVA